MSEAGWYMLPMVSPPPSEHELRKYAALLAWIMQSPDDRDEVEDTAVHVWRVSLTRTEHARLQEFLPPELREPGDD